MELEQIVFNLHEENVEYSVQQTMNLLDANFPFSFNFVICMLVHAAFSSRSGEANMYFTYLKLLQNKEEEANINNSKIIEIFCQYLSKNKTQESYYLLEKMIEQNLIYSSITKSLETEYFAQYKTVEEFRKEDEYYKHYKYDEYDEFDEYDKHDEYDEGLIRRFRDPFYDAFVKNIKELSNKMKFISIISCFKIIFGISSNYLKQHLFGHLIMVTPK